MRAGETDRHLCHTTTAAAAGGGAEAARWWLEAQVIAGRLKLDARRLQPAAHLPVQARSEVNTATRREGVKPKIFS